MRDEGRIRILRGSLLVPLLLAALAAPALAEAGTFAPPHADRGVDTDGDGKYNRLDVDARLTITSGGTFLVFASLYAPDDTPIATASRSATLDVGPRTVTVSFPGIDISRKGKDGPYRVPLTLYDRTLTVLATDTHYTAAYAASDFQPPPGNLAPPHADAGVDLDGNGLYDRLAVDVRVQVNATGAFRVQGNLYDGPVTILIDATSETRTLSPGLRTVRLEFTGYLISRYRVDGPYTVRLWLYDGAGALLSQGTHATAPYAWTAFEPQPATLAPPHADAGVDFDGNGKYDYLRVAVRLNVARAGAYAVEGELWEDAQTNPAFLGYTRNETTLPAGAATVDLYFLGSEILSAGVTGRYLAHLAVIDAAGDEADAGTHQTQRYRSGDFDPLPASFAPPHADRGVDADGNGRYEALVVDASLSVRLSFPYRLVGRLWNGGETKLLATARADPYLPSGPRQAPLAFDGREIRNGSTPGPYVARLQLFDPFGNLLHTGAHTTAPYAVTDFESWVPVDAAPPSVADVRADPDPQLVGGVVTVSAIVTDDIAVAGVWLDVAGVGNASMAYDPGTGRYAHARAYGTVGPHDFAIWAVDTAGKWGSASGQFTIRDGTAPAIADVRVDPRPQEVPGTVTVSAIVTDDVGVAGVWLDVAGVGNASMAYDPGTGRHSLARAYGTVGVFPFTVWAADGAGNWGSASGDIRIVDTTPPAIADVRAVPAQQTPGGVVNVSARIGDNDAVAEARISVRDPSGVLIVDVPLGFDPASGRHYDARPYATVGTYGFTLTARDPSGNEARANGSFQITTAPDTTPPAILAHRATPDPGEAFAPVRIEAVVADDRGVASASVAVTSPTGADLGNATMAFDGIAYAHEAAYGELGVHGYCVWALDAAGNAASACGSFTIRDTTPPWIGDLSAAPDPAEVGTPVTISARVTDPVGVASVDLAVRDPTGAILGPFPMAGAGDAYVRAHLATRPGLHGFTITARDGSGNVATLEGTFLAVDTTPPSIADAAATPDPQEVHLDVRISATVADADRVASVRVEVRDPLGATLGPFPMVEESPGAFAFARAYGELGVHGYTIRAADPSGNEAVLAGTFAIRDTTPPAAIAGPDVSARVGEPVAFDGTASTDNDRIVAWTWTFRDGAADVSLEGATAAHAFASPGTVLVTLTVRDRAGNEGTDALLVTVIAPTVAPPQAPTGLTAQPAGPRTVRLAWTPVTERTDGTPLVPAGYHVYRGEGDAPLARITETPWADASYEDGDRTLGVSYRYAVTAVDDEGRESARSAEATVALPATGGIRGWVSDVWTPLEGALVTVERDGRTIASVRTGSDGRFAFPDLEPGAYTVRASREGYVPRAVPAEVAAGSWTDLGRIPLSREPGAPWPAILASPWFAIFVLALVIILGIALARRRARRRERGGARKPSGMKGKR